MPLFFSMSLAGSIPLCIGLLIMILQKEQTNFYYVNSLFKLSVILYLLPLQLIKNQQYTSQIIQTSFHGSLTSFISAFTGNKKLSASDKEELMDFLKGL